MSFGSRYRSRRRGLRLATLPPLLSLALAAPLSVPAAAASIADDAQPRAATGQEIGAAASIADDAQPRAATGQEIGARAEETSVFGAGASGQAPTPRLYLDGEPLELGRAPLVAGGRMLVPMRALFEAQGADIGWEARTGTVTAVKDGLSLIYRIGASAAALNGRAVTLDEPGRLVGGTTYIPLRFAAESLGALVKWYAYDNSVSLLTDASAVFGQTVAYGVNLRSRPDAGAESSVYRMLQKGESFAAVREIGEEWLEVRTRANEVGFVSAKPRYTDYRSDGLRAAQADRLIAFGAQYVGTPYVFGAASDRTDAFDCSSFVKRVVGETLGLELPRVSYDQAETGREVSLDELRIGDLLFFGARGLEIGHVAFYAGDGMLLHTYSDEEGVHFEAFAGQWKERFVTARTLW